MRNSQSSRHPSCRTSSSSGSRSTGMAARSQAHDSVRKSGGSPQAAVGAYCAGNQHLTENAKAVGNL